MSRTLISMLESSKIPGKTLVKNIPMNAGLVNTGSRQICRESCHHSSPPPPPSRTHLSLRLHHSERRCTRANHPAHRSRCGQRGDSLIKRCTAW